MEPKCMYCGNSCAFGYGYCHCGCGEKTSVATRMNPLAGEITGVPLRFVQWHIWRKNCCQTQKPQPSV
jgi:hypothetical protein